MGNVNIPAVATGTFLGLLAIIVLISCVPPVTRFLGDLCCCPWHIPFTKRRRRNADEEMDKDDLPYVAGPPSPRVGSPVDDVGYHRVSAAYMSAVSVVDPELAKEQRRQSREYNRDGSPYRAHRQHRPQSGDFYQQHQQHQQRHSGYYRHPHSGASSNTHLQVPPPGGAGAGGGPPPSVWRTSSSSHSRSPDRRRRSRSSSQNNIHHNYPPYEGGGYGYNEEEEVEDGYYHDAYAPPPPPPHGAQPRGGEEYRVDVQRPQHAYSPPEMSMVAHHGGHAAAAAAPGEGGYFPPPSAPSAPPAPLLARGPGYDEGYYSGGRSNMNSNMGYENYSSEYLVGPRQDPHNQI